MAVHYLSGTNYFDCESIKVSTETLSGPNYVTRLEIVSKFHDGVEVMYGLNLFSKGTPLITTIDGKETMKDE